MQHVVIMEDRELLELAAKAAGIKVLGPVEKWIAQPRKEHEGGFLVSNDRGGDSCWNPLTDDGDALRLAVKLELDIQSHGAWTGDTPDELAALVQDGNGLDVFERHAGDPCAATRRAIVRAAAEVGRGMPRREGQDAAR